MQKVNFLSTDQATGRPVSFEGVIADDIEIIAAYRKTADMPKMEDGKVVRDENDEVIVENVELGTVVYLASGQGFVLDAKYEEIVERFM